MDASHYLNAARVPSGLYPQTFGDSQFQRRDLPKEHRQGFQWPDFTILRHTVEPNMGNTHLLDNDDRVFDVVMEDSPRELRKHLPIWMNARGRVLITGLGLGCVVRGLLASTYVIHIDVVGIDADIIRIVGAEFAGNARVALHHGDATSFQFPDDVRFDCAWHDLWMDEGDGHDHLQRAHCKLICNYADRIPRQGARAFPPFAKKLIANAGIGYMG
jgi:spermidine synthase